MTVIISTNRFSKQRAFTLVELVAVIVLLGILSVSTTQVIKQGVSIYSDTVERDRLQQEGRYVVERVSRELRLALPGSVRVGSSGGVQCVEFMPINAATTYLTTVTAAAVATLDVVDFNYSFVSGDLAVIYPIETTSVYGAASVNDAAAIGTLSGLSDPVAGDGKLQLSFSAENFQFDSPQSRLYVIARPVSFCVSNGEIRRYEAPAYGRSVSQPVPPAVTGVLMSKNIRTDDGGAFDVFSYTGATQFRAGIVSMDFRFSEETTLGTDWVRFSQEVALRNAP